MGRSAAHPRVCEAAANPTVRAALPGYPSLAHPNRQTAKVKMRIAAVPAHDLSIKEHAPERLEARRNNTVADPASPCLGGVPYLVVIGDHGIKVGGFICRCEFSTSLRRPGAGRMARRVIARPALALPRRSSGPVGVSGMVRSGALSISSTKLWPHPTTPPPTHRRGRAEGGGPSARS